MIHRVQMATINYDHPQHGQIHAFNTLFEAQHFDYFALQRQKVSVAEINNRFVRGTVDFKPDWLWLQVQDSNILTANSLERIRQALPKVVITHWTGDARPEVSAYLGAISRACDLSLTSSGGRFLEAFKAAGAKRVQHLQIGLDWSQDVLGIPAWEPSFKADVVFCGNHYGGQFPGTPAREHAIRVLKNADINVGVVGANWPRWVLSLGTCTVKQQHHVYRRAKVALSINHFNDIDSYYSDRQLIAMASGTPVVCRYVPGLEREFVSGTHCIWYTNEAELLEAVRKLLRDPELAARVGAAGRAEVIRRHTWLQRVLELTPTIEELQRTK